MGGGSLRCWAAASWRPSGIVVFAANRETGTGEIRMTHSARLTHNLKVDLGDSGAEIEVRDDGELLGTLTLRGGSVDWQPANAKYVLHYTWREFAKMMKEKYASSA